MSRPDVPATHHTETGTPTTVLNGFLGAGKTTLLNRILAEPDGVRFGVLVNDFGAINVDAALVVTRNADQISLANGCICCSIRDDLVAAARQLLNSEPKPDRIIVEASGVSRPLAIVDALLADDLGGALALDAVLCLVDADSFGGLDYQATELAIDQAACADLLIINKCDLAGEAAVADVEATLRGPMPNVRVLRTSFAKVPRSVLFGPEHPGAPLHWLRAQSRSGSGHEHSHDHDEEFESWSWQTDSLLDLTRFKAAVRDLPTSLLRAKGILRFEGSAGKRGIFHLVGKRSTVVLDPADPPQTSVFVAIARRGTLAPARLATALDGCRAARESAPNAGTAAA